MSALELGHPVGAGKSAVAGAHVQHLHDVLGLEHFGLDPIERNRGPVAARTLLQMNAGVGQQGDDALMHAALRDGEVQSFGRISGFYRQHSFRRSLVTADRDGQATQMPKRGRMSSTTDRRCALAAS